jgi:hypothetical protein
MAAAGAGGSASPNNIHNLITSVPSPLPANVMSHIASFVPNWHKIPVFDKFKNKTFHQTPYEVVEQIRAGDQALLSAYIDYLDSANFNAARSRYGPDRPAQDRQSLLNELLCDTVGRAPFESLKQVVDAGADINLRMGMPCYGEPLLLVLRGRIYGYGHDNLRKFKYLIERGARTNIRGDESHTSLLDQAIHMNLFDEIALIVNSGQNIISLNQYLLTTPHYAIQYLSGILAALLIRNDVVNEEVFEQLLALPAETVSGAMARLTALVRAGQLPASIIANISNRSFQNFRQLLINTLGKEEALAAVSALVGTTAMHRRAHIVSSALKGGRRHGQKRRATKKRRTIRR